MANPPAPIDDEQLQGALRNQVALLAMGKGPDGKPIECTASERLKAIEMLRSVPSRAASSRGGQGEETAPHHTRSDLRLLGQAIRHRWDIPEKVYKEAPEEMERIIKTGSLRERCSAATILAKMHEQNEGTHSTVEVGIGIATGEAVRDAMGAIGSDAGYQEYLRSGASDSDASAICEAGIGGDADALEAREASRRNGSGRNGRAAGRNGDPDG